MMNRQCPFEKWLHPAHVDYHRCVKDEGHDGPHDVGCLYCGSVLVGQDKEEGDE